MLSCPHCKHPLEVVRVLSDTTRRHRQRAGVPLDWLYCFTCRQYQAPEAFSKDPRPIPFLCDLCVDALLAE